MEKDGYGGRKRGIVRRLIGLLVLLVGMGIGRAATFPGGFFPVGTNYVPFMAYQNVTGWWGFLAISNTTWIPYKTGTNGQILTWSTNTVPEGQWEPGTIVIASNALFPVVAPLVYDIDTGALSIPQASTTVDGYLSASNFLIFYGKQDLISTGTVGQFYGWDKTMRKPSWTNLTDQPTGTVGRLVKFLNETNYGNSVVYESGAKIGIGMVPVAVALEVNGSARIWGAGYFDSDVIIKGWTYASNGLTAVNSGGTNWVFLSTNAAVGKVLMAQNTNGVMDWGWYSFTNLIDGGTANYLPKWSGGLLTSTSRLYDDGTNIGLGMTNPAYALDIYYGSINLTNTARYRALDTGGVSRTLAGINATNVAVIGANAGGVSLQLNAGDSTPGLFITNTTRWIGVGTSAPTNQLQVNGTFSISSNGWVSGDFTVISNLYAKYIWQDGNGVWDARLTWPGSGGDYGTATNMARGDHTHGTNAITGLPAWMTNIVNTIAGKEATIAAGTSAQFYRGDKVMTNALEGPLYLKLPTAINGNYVFVRHNVSETHDYGMRLVHYSGFNDASIAIGGATNEGLGTISLIARGGTITVASNGYLGVLISSPTNALDVNGNASIRTNLVVSGTANFVGAGRFYSTLDVDGLAYFDSGLIVGYGVGGSYLTADAEYGIPALQGIDAGFAPGPLLLNPVGGYISIGMTNEPTCMLDVNGMIKQQGYFVLDTRYSNSVSAVLTNLYDTKESNITATGDTNDYYNGTKAFSKVSTNSMPGLNLLVTNLQTQINGKEPTITGTGDTNDYYNGNKAFAKLSTNNMVGLNALHTNYQTQINGKEPSITATGNTNQYYNGNKSFSFLSSNSIVGHNDLHTNLQTQINNKEPGLGNPTTNGHVLASTTAGTRYWTNVEPAITLSDTNHIYRGDKTWWTWPFPWGVTNNQIIVWSNNNWVLKPDGVNPPSTNNPVGIFGYGESGRVARFLNEETIEISNIEDSGMGAGGLTRINSQTIVKNGESTLFDVQTLLSTPKFSVTTNRVVVGDGSQLKVNGITSDPGEETSLLTKWMPLESDSENYYVPLFNSAGLISSDCIADLTVPWTNITDFPGESFQVIRGDGTIGEIPGHQHAAPEISSGTFDIARIPTGTNDTTVSIGNHNHGTGTTGAIPKFTGSSTFGDSGFSISGYNLEPALDVSYSLGSSSKMFHTLYLGSQILNNSGLLFAPHNASTPAAYQFNSDVGNTFNIDVSGNVWSRGYIQPGSTGFKSYDGTSGATEDVQVLSPGPVTNTLHFKNGLYVGKN